MSLSAAAAAMGLPEALVERSAEARSAETGQSVDDILAAWAGGEAMDAPAPASAEDVADAASSADAEAIATATDAGEEAPEAAEPEEAPAPVTPVIETPQPAAAGAAAPTRAPTPTEVTAAEALSLPEVITVPTAGIKERTNFVIPTWLTGLLIVIPLFALFALTGSATGACGEATELEVNVITGEAVNCDGSEFTGSGAAGGGTDFIALGENIYNGNEVAGVNCAGCHGANGQGGVGPALGGVLTTFGACTDHVEWVALGSGGWPESTYGDTNKQVTEGMPGFRGSLSEEQIAAVTTFERVRFGGEDPAEAVVDCGLAEGEEEDGESDEGDEDGTGTTVPTEGEGEAEASAAQAG